MRAARFGLLFWLATGCTGSDGLVGPTGPPGPEGQAGPGTRLVIIATVGPNNTISRDLPVEAGSSINDPPLLACYIRPETSNTWVVVADGFGLSQPYCVLEFANGRFTATIRQAPAGWLVAFVVIY